MYAEDHELGFDPTMKVVKASDGTSQYEITVRDEAGDERLYRTIKVLSASGGRYLIGRGTRVWKAVEIVDGVEVGDPVALKDCWVDSHREREGTITARIRASPMNDEDKEQLHKVLITVLTHGDVFVDDACDRTRVNPRSRKDDDLQARNREGAAHSKPDRYQIHYRIVYLEVGVPLSEFTLLSDVYKTLGDACVGTWILEAPFSESDIV